MKNVLCLLFNVIGFSAVGSDVEIRINETSDFSQLAVYENVVVLNYPDEIFLSSIERAVILKSGILIQEDSKPFNAYLFSHNGDFIRSFGREGKGPGEFENLREIAVDDEENVYLFDFRKTMKFDISGKLLLEAERKYDVRQAVFKKDRFYVDTGDAPRLDVLPETIVIMNKDLADISCFHPYDGRSEGVRFSTKRSLTLLGDSIVISNSYDFELDQYDLEGRLLDHFSISRSDIDKFPQLGERWSLAEKEKIFNNLDRSLCTFGVDDETLFLYRTFPSKRISEPCLLNVKTRTLYRFPLLSFMFRKGMPEGFPKMHGIVGVYDEGLIGCVNDPSEYPNLVEFFPNLEGVENPTLFFLAINI